jgi:hypothetical protein
MLVAALVTLTGTLGQVTAVTWQGAELTTGRVHWGVIVLGGLVGAVIWWYGTKSLWEFADSGSKKPRRTTSEAVAAAKVVAKAIRETSGGPARAEDDEVAEIEREGVRVSPEKRNALL